MAYNVKFLKGTQESFNQLGENRDLNTFYYLDNANLYLGNIKLSSAAELADAISRLGAVEGVNTTQTADIAKLREDLNALTGGSGNGSISDMISTAVKALEDDLRPDVEKNTEDIAALQQTVSDHKTEVDRKVDKNTEDIAALQQTVSDNSTAVNGKISALETSVADNTANITTLTTGLGTANNNISDLQGRMTTVEGTAQANATSLNTLIGEDTGKSARAIAIEELTNVLVAENASESYDTLQEMAQWLQEHPESAAEMAKDIGLNKAAIEAINGEDGILANAQEYTDDQIAIVQGQIDVLQGEGEGSVYLKAKAYTDTKVGEVNTALETYKTDNNAALDAVRTTASGADSKATQNATDITELRGIVASNASDAAQALTNAINTLKTEYNITQPLKSAAFETREYFENLSANAYTGAVEYIDAALTWGSIS